MSVAPPLPSRCARLGWLGGALLLAAFATWWPWMQDRDDYRLFHPDVPVPVAFGEWGAYEGARWRLVDLQEPGPQDLAGITHRPDAKVVLATLEVMPDTRDGTAPDALDACRSVLQDPAGRRWEAQPLALSRFPQKPLGFGCGSRLGEGYRRETALPGSPFRFRQIYLLPNDAPLRDLQLHLHLPRLQREPAGTFIAFTLPE